MRTTLIYDYNPDGTERPVWLLIDLDGERDRINYEKSLYVDIRKSKREFIGTFDDDFIGSSVCLNELTSGRYEYEFGIDMLLLRRRYGHEFDHVRRLIVLASDVAETMSASAILFD